jgi:hypothetical protein
MSLAIGLELQVQLDAVRSQLTNALESARIRGEALERAEAEVARLTAAKNGAYAERNLCVALIARMAGDLLASEGDFDAWLAEHDPADTAWERDWLNIVFVVIPTGQLSWHIHDSELPLFDFLPRRRDSAPEGFPKWDGHTTEQKYERIRAALKAGGLEL